MATDLGLVLDQVSKDKDIERSYLVDALEEAILAAAKRAFGLERDLASDYNEEKGAVDLSQTIRVVREVTDTFNEISLEECKERDIEVEEGDEMVFPIYYLELDEEAALEQDETYGDILGLKTYHRSFGRIAAQTAKQVIIQRIRDVERGVVYNEYKDRKDELVTGIVRRFERGNLIVDLGRAEAILPQRHQCPRESYRTGDRVQAYVVDVQEHARGPQIVLSRTCNELLVKLFEIEVPEIHEGVVRIESAAREPGSRAKIAVSSTDRDVDPVGACVGMKGSRVQAVVQELRGEKIDIVPYSADTATFVCNALQPAEVSRVLIDEGNHSMEIIVPDDQLSLAIGRRGQNVRLASSLSGWRLDINSETKIQEIRDRTWASLSRVEGCSEFLIQTLYNHGIRSAKRLVEVDREYLLQFPGISADNIDTLWNSAREVAHEEYLEEQAAQREAEQQARAREIAGELRKIIAMDDEGVLRLVRGIGDSALGKLSEMGITSVGQMVEAGQEGLTEVFGDAKARHLLYGARAVVKDHSDVRDRASDIGIEIVDGEVVVPGDEPEGGVDGDSEEGSDAAASEVAGGTGDDSGDSSGETELVGDAAVADATVDAGTAEVGANV